MAASAPAVRAQGTPPAAPGPADGDAEGRRRQARWIAEAMARTDLSPLRRADVEALARLARVREAPAGTVLARAGEAVATVSVVRAGQVRLAARRPGGGRSLVALVSAGGVVGDVGLLCAQPMPYDAVAETDVTLLDLDGDDLLALLRASPTLSLRWTTSVAERLERTERRLVTLLTKDLDAQVASLLLEAGEPDGHGGWQARLSHATLAALLGVRRQSISRVMGRLREQGVVATRYRRVVLRDVDGLAAIAGEPLPTRSPA